MFGTKILIRNVILYKGGNGVLGHTKWTEAPWVCIPGARSSGIPAYVGWENPCVTKRGAF